MELTESAASTGYRWMLDACGEMLRVADEVSRSGVETRPGSSGTRRFLFTAVAPGECSIHLALRRPWESAAESAETMTLQVTVRA